jgi:hypothetical protein
MAKKPFNVAKEGSLWFKLWIVNVATDQTLISVYQLKFSSQELMQGEIMQWTYGICESIQEHSGVVQFWIKLILLF